MYGTMISRMGQINYSVNLTLAELVILHIFLSSFTPNDFVDQMDFNKIRSHFAEMDDKTWEGIVSDILRDFQALRLSYTNWSRQQIPVASPSKKFPYLV